MSKIVLRFGNIKHEAKKTEEELKRFGRQWISNARRSLTAQNAKASGELYNSFPDDPRIYQKGGTFGVDITPDVDYWEYLDKGVQGAKSSPFRRQRESPFKYTTKFPPAGAIDRWVIRKGISPRDERGRFIDRKSLTFLIRRAIYTRGIKPRLFITGTKERIQKKAILGIGRAVTKDIANALREMVKENTNGTNL